MGHSMGGMVATRFGLLYPDVVEKLVLYNQIGLTDARLERPPASVDATYKTLLNQTYDTVYQGIARYFPGGMKPEYERYVKVQYGWSLSGNWPQAAMVRALAQQMVYEDPWFTTGLTSRSRQWNLAAIKRGSISLSWPSASATRFRNVNCAAAGPRPCPALRGARCFLQSTIEILKVSMPGRVGLRTVPKFLNDVRSQLEIGKTPALRSAAWIRL